jgi:hypothetical protein
MCIPRLFTGFRKSRDGIVVSVVVSYRLFWVNLRATMNAMNAIAGV